MYWSVPVSQGYGRRMRFLVRDKQNGKMIGLFGLTDPVFNLRVRDNWIGWDVEQRKRNLRSVMDAFVLGAIPPYSHLLGGKLVCTLLASSEVREAYHKKYSEQKSVIRGRIHDNDLLLLTTTSALGKSSLYDRIRMNKRTYFYSVGVTEGYGHFHIPQRIFHKMRRLLQLMNHPYATKNRFGHGPNWRMRVIRVALKECGFNPHLLKHQIKRESFMIPLARNSKLCLREKSKTPVYFDGNVSEIAENALRRWVVPRAERKPSYRMWDRIEFLRSIAKMIR
ncbi:MAG: Druantia anti-phage system protein DruA, partial [Candidatus Thorarchaeota archaeon]